MRSLFKEMEAVYLGNRRGRIKRLIPTDQEDLYEVCWDDGRENPNIIEKNKLRKEPLDKISYKQCPECIRIGRKEVNCPLKSDNPDSPTGYSCCIGHSFRKKDNTIVLINKDDKEIMLFNIVELIDCPLD